MRPVVATHTRLLPVHTPARSPRGPEMFKAQAKPAQPGQGQRIRARASPAHAAAGYWAAALSPAWEGERRSRMRTDSMRLSRTDSTRIE